MADTSLIFGIIARDKTAAVFARIKRNAESTGSLAAKALGPAMVPVVASSAAALAGMGAALASAGAAAGVFGAVAASAFNETKEASDKTEDLRDKIELLGRQAEMTSGAMSDKYLKAQAKAALELEARLSLLPPAQREAVVEYGKMKDSWQAFVDTNKPTTFGIMSQGYKLITTLVGKLQPLYNVGASAARDLIAAMTGAANGGGLDRFIANAEPAMDSLVQIFINLGTVVTSFFGKFDSQGKGMLRWVEDMTTKWATWATAADGEGINKFVDYVAANGPRVTEMLSNLAAAAMNIARAVAPLAPISMAVAGALTAIIAAVPPEIITALVAGFLAFNIAMKLWAIGTAIATAAQWAYNAAMLASPTTWIILAIIALVAVIVLIATKTTWFQTIWQYVWGFMKGVGAWFAGPFADFFVGLYNKIVTGIKWVWNAIKTYITFWINIYKALWNGAKWVIDKTISGFTTVVNFVKGIPGKISGALRNMWSPLWGGFKAAINNVIRGWNSLSFTIPSVTVFGKTLGGGTIGTPNIPMLDVGGHVQQSGLAIIHRGETVTPAKVSKYEGGGGGVTLVFQSDGSRASRLLLEILRESIRDKGGDPVKVLTPR